MSARILLGTAALVVSLGTVPLPVHASPAESPTAPAPAGEPPPAAPGELSVPAVAECVAAHDSAGFLRLKERWLDARAAIQRCVDPACPIAIRSDCRTWREEIAATMPTLLVVVERDDDGRHPVRLELDGRTLDLPEKLGPIEVLPGTHRLRFTLEGYPPVDVRVALAKGEKNHVVHARFERPKPAAPPPPSTSAPRRRLTRPVPLATYLYGAGSLLSLGTSAALFGLALDSRANAREACAPDCPRERRKSIDRRLLIVDIVGGAGLVLGGLALHSYVRRPWVLQSTRAELDVVVAVDRASVVVGGSF